MSSQAEQTAGGLVISQEASEALRYLQQSRLTARDGVQEARFTGRLDDPTRLYSECQKIWTAIRTFAVSINLLVDDMGRSHELRLTKRGSVVIVEVPEGIDPADVRNAADPSLLEQVWDGDAQAAFAIPGEWNAELSIALDDLFVGPLGVDLRAALRLDTIARHISERAPWQLEELAAPVNRRRVFVALDVSLGGVRTGHVSVVGVGVPDDFDSNAPTVLDREAIEPLLTGDKSAEWRAIIDHFLQAETWNAWTSMANGVEKDHDDIALNFFGYRSVILRFDQNFRFTETEAQEAQELARWAHEGGLADKLLAVRQIVSLYPQTDEPLRAGRNVLKSAQMVYVGLRSEVVGEVVRAVRDAEAKVSEAVRQTVIAAQTLLKNATERAMAVGLAVAGALLGRSTDVVQPDVAASLLMAVAVGLLLLAAWSHFVESPLVDLQIKQFGADLVKAEYVTERMRTALMETPSLSSTQDRVRWTKHAPTVLYVCGAAAVWFLAVPAVA